MINIQIKFDDIHKDNQMKDNTEIFAMYDKKVVLKFLRLLEIFTSIAVKSKQINQFVLRVTNSDHIQTLLKLFLKCRLTQHAMIILKIFGNLIKLGVGMNTLDEAMTEVKTTTWSKQLFDTKTKANFGECAFLQFCYNSLLNIRASQWSEHKLQSYGSYNISSGIVRLLKLVIHTGLTFSWSQTIQTVLDDFLASPEDFSNEEFDILMSLFEGGEPIGMIYGSHGKTKDDYKFTVVGFARKWYGFTKEKTDDENKQFPIYKINTEYCDARDKLLAIYYDDKNPEKNEMFMTIPDEVSLISNLSDKYDDYLLNKNRFNNFLKLVEIDQLPNTTEHLSMSKR